MTSASSSLQNLLGDEAVRPGWRRPLPWVLAALLLIAAGTAWWWLGRSAQQAAPRFVTEPLARGTLQLNVTANGKLQATRTVSIGSELSGTVAQVRVDVNDVVKKGQVLVELDTAKLLDQIASARAAVASADAGVGQAVAAVKEARANLQRLEEVHRLSNGQVPSAAELDSARATLDKTVAAENAARAAVTSARATLSTNETNLSKASIRSPIDGVVLTRAVEPGYAVAASLQAVTLFTIAEDLSRLQLSVNVDEADVGQVQAGQAAKFSVSAWPGRHYPAQIVRVAYGSTITDNVVTYTTLMDVPNADLSLRPGMTATAVITATERRDVWLVPNRALRFTPAEAGSSPGSAPAAAASGAGGGIVSKLMPRPPGGATPRRSSGAADKSGGAGSGPKRLWVLQDGRPVAVEVTAGLSNGRLTEVSGPALREGMAVITEQASGSTGAAK
ncbi:efflux RND transporter periplasmic adaptor subunit [Sphaerotilus microaerophilus]|uniref:Secretion protein HlyD n=1 Tax=Sphaerotilus microaerophilus TaxID=2914710 RepID=A0ABM7YHR9_9BURK|nr:efflux RND transporter periplasmic adaptor subunit [Sphaerotilus sp. FB-5]BDI03892.1 secretion protein HlyD [Sphaerotilus sp. FB-5]